MEKLGGKHVLFVVTEDWYFCSHRLPLALALIKAGCKVSLATRINRHGERIRSHDIAVFNIFFRRGSLNPFMDFRTFSALYNLYRREQPDVIHHVALKPVIVGSLSAIFARSPHVVNALTGLGYVFSSDSWNIRLLRKIILRLFRIILNRPGWAVIFQNSGDMEELSHSGIISGGRAALIKGSGVDLRHYCPGDFLPGVPIAMFAGRLLRNKGVEEFVQACRLINRNGQRIRCVLVGFLDTVNPSVLDHRLIDKWTNEGLVEWWGFREDMPEVINQSRLVCLPTYYGEGLPKVLLEAAACGRPVVATDIPGCREIVRDGETGLLVPPRDYKALAAAIERLVADPDLCRHMGENARRLVDTEFSVEKVNQETLKLYERLLYDSNSTERPGKCHCDK